MQATEKLVATLRKPRPMGIRQLTVGDLAALDAWLSEAYRPLRRHPKGTRLRQEAIRESRRILAAIKQNLVQMIPWADAKRKVQGLGIKPEE